MKKAYPVKLPVILALLAVLVAPVAAIWYSGILEMNFYGWLSIFAPVRTGLDLGQAALFLIFVLGEVYLLWKLRNAVGAARCDALSVFLKVQTGVAVLLVPVTALYSVFPDSLAFCCVWTGVFSVSLVLGACIGFILIGFSRKPKNRWLLALGVLLACSHVFDYSGFRALESAVDRVFPAGQESFQESELSHTIWGLSAQDYELLDDDAKNDMEEFTQFALYGVWAAGTMFIVVHSAAFAGACVIMCVLFSLKNKEKLADA